jgi:hypothetical protein
LLMPFMEYPSSTVINSTFEESEWTLESKTGEETFSRCKYSYTRLLYSAEGKLRDGIGRQEKVMAEVTEDVLAAICSVIIQVGFQIEYEWLSLWNNLTAAAKQTWSSRIIDQASFWQRELEELIAWLGWAADEVRCEQLCSTDEYCHIPMWPLTFLGNRGPRRRPPRLPGNGTRPAPPEDEHPPYAGRPPYRYGSSPPGLGPPSNFPEFEEDLWSPRCMQITSPTTMH